MLHEVQTLNKRILHNQVLSLASFKKINVMRCDHIFSNFDFVKMCLSVLLDLLNPFY